MIFNTAFSTRTGTHALDDQATDVIDWTVFTIVDLNVPASLQQMSQSESFKFSRRGFDVDFEVFTTIALTAPKDARGVDANGNFYQIVIPCEDMAGRGRMFCTRLKKLEVL